MIFSLVCLLAVFGLFLAMANFKKKGGLWAIGLLMFIGGGGFLAFQTTQGIHRDGIGATVLQHDETVFELAFRYYPRQKDALQYFKNHRIRKYFVFAKYDGSSKTFFETVLPGGSRFEKRVRFEGDSKNSGNDIFNDFFMKNGLITVAISPELKASLEKKKHLP